MAVAIAGLASAITLMGVWFDAVRIAGAAYLIWLGIKLLRSKGELLAAAVTKPKGGFFLQGFVVILSNPKVKAVLFNIFGGITRCDEVARGLIEAFDRVKPDAPFVVRLDGTNDEEGRRLLAEANLPNVTVEKTMLGAAAKVVELANS